MNTGEIKRYELFPFIKGNLQEYLFALQPDDPSGELLTRQRKKLQQEYGGDGMPGASINIPVLQFFSSEQMEERIIRWIQRLCADERTFSLYGSVVQVAAKHAILLTVKKEAVWHRFVQRLRVIDDFMAAENCPPMQEVANPFLSLAQTASAAANGDEPPVYNSEEVSHPVVINGLILWSRKHEFSPWKIVHVFHLSPV